MYFDYRDIDELTKDARDYTNCSAGLGDERPGLQRLVHQPARPLPGLQPRRLRVGDYVLDVTTGNTFRPRAGDVYNYAPYNFMQRPDEK